MKRVRVGAMISDRVGPMMNSNDLMISLSQRG